MAERHLAQAALELSSSNTQTHLPSPTLAVVLLYLPRLLLAGLRLLKSPLAQAMCSSIKENKWHITHF
jgi:hypothetical protein